MPALTEQRGIHALLTDTPNDTQAVRLVPLSNDTAFDRYISHRSLKRTGHGDDGCFIVRIPPAE